MAKYAVVAAIALSIVSFQVVASAQQAGQAPPPAGVQQAPPPPPPAAPGCPMGMLPVMGIPGACCWPGQAFSAQTNQCVGTPSCPQGLYPQGTQCAQPNAGMAPGPQQPPPGTVYAPAPQGYAPAPQGYAQPVYVQPGYGQPGYGQPMYVPMGPRPRRHRGLIAGGAVLFVIGWLGSIIEGAVIQLECSGYSYGCSNATTIAGYTAYIPVIGSWATLALGAADGHWDPTALVGTAILGLFQLGGLVMLIGGARSGRSMASDDSPHSRHPAWAVYPTVGPNNLGLGLTVTNF